MDKGKLTSFGGALSAILASICCVGPVLLAGLGVGTGGIGFVKGFGSSHIFFIVLTFTLLGTAFYFTYRKRRKSDDQTAGCCPANDKRNRTILWIATAVAVVFLILPFLM